MIVVVYKCKYCEKKFSPVELHDLEPFGEDEWEYSCLDCGEPLSWSLIESNV